MVYQQNVFSADAVVDCIMPKKFSAQKIYDTFDSGADSDSAIDEAADGLN